MNTCPTCGQTLPERRVGVRLTPRKARIFDHVKRYGEEGIPVTALAAFMDMKVVTVKSHIWQINDLLEDTGWRIKPTVPRNGYRLCQLKLETANRRL